MYYINLHVILNPANIQNLVVSYFNSGHYRILVSVTFKTFFDSV
jgi:hypothetical protein